jgi:hypothetical protein
MEAPVVNDQTGIFLVSPTLSVVAFCFEMDQHEFYAVLGYMTS